MAGVTVTASTGLTIGEEDVKVTNYGKCFKLVTEAAATDYTVTMTAPEGYVITGYYLGCSANTKDAVHTLTSEDGSVSVVASAPPYNNPVGRKVFEVTDLNTNSTHFTINTASKGNTLYLPKFYIYIAKSGEVCNVTYKVLLEASGTVKTTATEVEFRGNTLAVPSACTRDYCTYTFYSDEACTSALTTVPDATSATVYTLASYTMPFTVSTDYANAVWHNMKLHTTYPLYNSDNTTNVKLPANPGTEINSEWAFIGNPYDGFQIINKGAGDGLVLGSATDDAGSTGAGSYATMATSGTQIYEKWFPRTSIHYTNGFYLYNSNDHALNKRSNDNLAYWTGGADAGSTFTVSSVTANATELTAIADKLDACTYGTAFGEYSLSGAYTGYESYMKTVIIPGLKSGYTYEHLLNARAIKDAKSLNMPEAGSFLRIKGNTSGKYLASGLASNNKFNMTKAEDATTIFYFDGTRLTNFGSGMCNGMNKSAWEWVVGNSASTVVFQDGLTNGGYGIKSATCNFYDNGDNSNSADRGDNVTITESTNKRYTKWQLTEVTSLPVTFNSAALGYATFNSPVALEIPKDVKAYVCRIDGETIKFFNANKYTDGDGNWILPANTAVLLYNKDYLKDETKDFTIVSEEGSYGEDENKFEGTVAAVNPATGCTYYSLRKTKNVNTMGFYQRTSTAALAGFRAWIVDHTGGARNFTIVFDGDSDPTGIVEAMGLENDNVEIYDLNGRKLSSYQKGINIINGKKIFK